MVLDAVTAKALASIILVSMQGVDRLTPQLPLQAIDRGDSWLVKGTPYTDKARGLQYCVFHIFIQKTSAKVTGTDFDERRILSDDQKAEWSKSMTKEDFSRIFGPPTVFEPVGIPDIIYALYGGLINRPKDAVDYAHVLTRLNPTLAGIPPEDLQANERNTVWHVTARLPPRAEPVEILSFSRRDGTVLSGDL